MPKRGARSWRRCSRANEPRQAARDLRALPRRQSGPDHRAQVPDAVRAAGGGRALGAGDRQVGEPRDRVLFEKYDTPETIAKLGVAGLEQYIQTIGLYRNKAKNVVELSRLLVEKHGGEVPRTREELEALPGVGRKTANVVLNTAFGEPTIAVDTHIFRVANRTNIAPGQGSAGGRGRLLKFTPPRCSAERASLADPARPLRVHRAQAGVPGVPDPRPLRVPAEDEGLRCSIRRASRYAIRSSRRGRKYRAGEPLVGIEAVAVERGARAPGIPRDARRARAPSRARVRRRPTRSCT